MGRWVTPAQLLVAADVTRTSRECSAIFQLSEYGIFFTVKRFSLCSESQAEFDLLLGSNARAAFHILRHLNFSQKEKKGEMVIYVYYIE